MTTTVSAPSFMSSAWIARPLIGLVLNIGKKSVDTPLARTRSVSSPRLRNTPPEVNPAICSNDWLCVCQSTMSGTDLLLSVIPSCGFIARNFTIRSESGKFSGRNNTEFTTVNIAVVAPMPSARVEMAMSKNPGRFRKLRTPYRMSLISVSICVPPCLLQRFEWLDPRCPSRRYDTRNKNHDRQHDRHRRKRHHVDRLHTKQQRRHISRPRNSTRESDNDANDSEQHRTFQNESEHVDDLRAERHAHADLVCSLRDVVRRHTINTEHREQHGHACKCAQQQHWTSSRRRRNIDNVIHCLEVVTWY